MKPSVIYKLLTVKETASLLRVQRATIYILISTGALRAVKIGHAWRVHTESVEELIGSIVNEPFRRTDLLGEDSAKDKND
jgi:excisionase family DNA binding protein